MMEGAEDWGFLVAGHRGLIGRAIHSWLVDREHEAPRHLEPEVDLRDANAAARAFHGSQTVFLCAGVGGGLRKNLERSADLCRDTMLLLASCFEGARQTGARLIWFACACVYPGLQDRPMSESDLWAGAPELTSRPFAAAQLAGIELTRSHNQQYGEHHLALICPTIYGPGDDFSDDGHVVAIVLRRLHEAKEHQRPEITLWGDGAQRRQVMYAEDAAREAVDLAFTHSRAEAVLNVVGSSALPLCTIAEAARQVVGYEGTIRWDGHAPSGQHHKELAASPLRHPFTPLVEGLHRTYQSFVGERS